MADDEPDAESSNDGKNWFGRHQQAAWITAGASIVVALITALVPVLGSSGDDKIAGPTVTSPPGPAQVTVPVTVPVTVRTTVQTTVQTSARPTAQPTPPTASQPVETPLPASTAGTVLWQGSLLLDTYAKDLDVAPPGPASDAGSDGDMYMLLDQQLSAMNRTLLTRWARASPSLPGYKDCAATIQAGDIHDQQPLSKSAVLCVQTSAGNVARLRVRALPVNQYGMGYRATFDVVVWSGS
ncbi:hypothetical protein ACFV9C_31850 [Kribbella sp. NPDC059898]|uniref:hypothetical protein n=1 Tax=Kribbella sp. NPDC059898 TaxID=3346995 RepID=UPI00364DFEE2